MCLGRCPGDNLGFLSVFKPHQAARSRDMMLCKIVVSALAELADRRSEEMGLLDVGKRQSPGDHPVFELKHLRQLLGLDDRE